MIVIYTRFARQSYYIINTSNCSARPKNQRFSGLTGIRPIKHKNNKKEPASSLFLSFPCLALLIAYAHYTLFLPSRICDFIIFLSVFKISFIFQSRNGHNYPVSLITSKGAVEFRLGGWGSVSSVKKQSCQIFRQVYI